jgi:hypothetical protein
MITLTRKMFTMVLSVVVYDHKLTLGQWAGAGIVFAGISVEAWVKRKGQSLVTTREPRRLIYFFQRSMRSVFYRRRREQRSSHYRLFSVESGIIFDLYHSSSSPTSRPF